MFVSHCFVNCPLALCVQLNLNKIIVSDCCICTAVQPGAVSGIQTADDGRMPITDLALKNQLTAPCKLATTLVLLLNHSCNFHSY